jgi:hypothetical protein
MCRQYQPLPVNLFPQGHELLDELLFSDTALFVAFDFFFLDSALNVNNAVLTPDAPVLLSSTLDKRS